MTPRAAAPVVFVALMLSAFGAPPAPDLSGMWVFTHAGGRFLGRLLLQQAGASLTGTWHTDAGKIDTDQPVAAEVRGSTVYLTRFIGDQKQTYVLALSKDGSRLDGFGEGFFLSHTNLNLHRSLPPRANLTGEWYFWCAGNRFQGTIQFRQEDSAVAGTWHTETGKSERDSELTGWLDGDTLYLIRNAGGFQQQYVLTLSSDGTQLRGFGDGFGIQHANLDMRRRD